MKRWIAVSLGCLVIGAAALRVGTKTSRADAEREVAELAAENRSLKAGLAQRLSPTPEASAPTKPEPVAPPPSEEKPSPPGVRPLAGRSAAELLGLDPGRQKFVEDSYGRVLAKLQEAEKRHAVVVQRGEEVEIHIPPFPDEGLLLRNEWTHLLQSALTAPELERYAKLGLDQILFPREIGLWDRYVVLEPQEHAEGPKADAFGNRRWPAFYERWTRPGEPPVDPATRWPWSGPDATRLYAPLIP